LHEDLFRTALKINFLGGVSRRELHVGAYRQAKDGIGKTYRQDKPALEMAEILRMNAVMNNFSMYKKIELAFLVIGRALIVLEPARNFGGVLAGPCCCKGP
jgi:hypothetical protein